MGSWSVVWRLVASRVRGQMQYRTSFMLQSVGNFASIGVELLAVLVLFGTFGELAGWEVGEVAFLYGLVAVSFGFTELTSEGFAEISTTIKSGEFDRVLTRPLPAFLQVLAADVDMRQVGRIAQGVVALALAQELTGLGWTLPKAAVFAFAMISTYAVFFSVMVIGAAACFWTVERTEVQNVFTYGGTELASYPIHIYNRLLQWAFLYLVPLALTSYYPALYILDKPDPLGLPPALRFAAPLVAAAFFGLALLIWRFGLRHYQSTGS